MIKVAGAVFYTAGAVVVWYFAVRAGFAAGSHVVSMATDILDGETVGPHKLNQYLRIEEA